MTLRLQGVSKSVDGEAHIHALDLELHKGTMNVLLGPTLAGKTTLMRLMAGLDEPDTGQIFWNGEDVTGKRVQKRDVAMVYQQFVNYPSMTVRENIASPLKLRGVSAQDIERKVGEMADLLQLTPLLDRKPSEISGGQQQRCAIARALVKDVGLVLMDEPLANLDYKLREELRIEIPRLFAASGSIFVYATTEPEEALLLGGNTATLWQGRVTQFGPSTQVYRQPVDMVTASVYSDPPMNFLPVRINDGAIHFPSGQAPVSSDAALRLPNGNYKAGFRAHNLDVGEGGEDKIAFDATVSVTELTGSETYIHIDAAGETWVGLLRGPRSFRSGEKLRVCIDPSDLLYFDEEGRLAHPLPQLVEA
ncbi:ABC sugar (glycerol) transporter, ATPase subunit [Erythrobacter sp. NAP1]|uniref:ABC transporter ATP-binding protein n=1 Tax=Erythrobacter sp. NAP1 TaxID=237727 RepID=UPI0000685183|nr:ABC transporter ATP-binding protein [Erythrobacter sp. NAP1]EAQ27683.1 ABC sugar (glycerol) transporter, ATPase subunit [Erythrobacter sp. NAP1]